MSKLKITLKQGREYNGYAIGYCELQTLLAHLNPFAYSAGINGWSCDYYRTNGMIISTGYKTVGERIPYDIYNKYEKLAREYVKSIGFNGTCEARVEYMNSLIHDMLTEVQSLV